MLEMKWVLWWEAKRYLCENVNILFICSKQMYAIPGYAQIFFGPKQLTETNHSFTHILNVTEDATSTHKSSRNRCVCKWIFADDDPTFPIIEATVIPAIEWIQRIIDESSTNSIFIHCSMGLNRSATVALALSILKTQRPVLDLIHEIRMRDKRLIMTNNGFIEALCKWQKVTPKHH